MELHPASDRNVKLLLGGPLERQEADHDRYTKEQLSRLEEVYLRAGRQRGEQQSLELLREVVEGYPESNRAGCAAVTLGARLLEQGQLDEAERYLLRARDEWDDSFYGDGVQVGAMARVRLADVYSLQDRTSDAQSMVEEVLERYPDAVDHNGRPLRNRLGSGR